MPLAVSSPAIAISSNSITATPPSIQLKDMSSMYVSTSTKIGADFSPASVANSNSFTTTPRSIQLKDLSLMNASTSTAIDTNHKNLQLAKDGEDNNGQNNAFLPLYSSPRSKVPQKSTPDSQFTNGEESPRGFNYSNHSVTLIPIRGSQNNQPNASVKLYIPPKNNLKQKTTIEKVSSKNKLKDAVNDYCLKIDEQIKVSLSSIEPDVIRLLFDDDEFKDYFLEKVKNRFEYFNVQLKQRIQDQILDDEFSNTKSVSTNIDQPDQTQMTDNANVEIANDDDDGDLELTLSSGDTVMLDKTQSSSLESPSNRIDDQVALNQYRDEKQQQNIDAKPATEQEQMISNTHQFLDTQQFCNCDSTSIGIDEQDEVSQADTYISESVQPRNQSSEPQLALKSCDTIVLPDNERLTIAESQKAKNASEAAKLEKCCREIRMPNFLLEDIHIDAFIKMVRYGNGTISPRDMVTVLAMQQKEHYDRKLEAAQLDDIQILYEGKAGKNQVGHYICIHYRVEKREIYVYDSLFRKRISSNSWAIIKRRFPGSIPVNFVEPQTKQPDCISCGVFAIAYATTILLGYDPAEYPLLLGKGPKKYKTLLLRDHLSKMLELNKISLFPRIEAGKTLEMNQNMDVRVLIERLVVPIGSYHRISALKQSTILPQNDGYQITDSGKELNVLQDVDDANEDFVEYADLEQTLPNGKRKINNVNAGGNLKKKIKSKDAVGKGNSTNRFKCNICPYSTKRKFGLTIHLRTHNGERPFKCKICKKRFTQKQHLNTHMKTHRNLFAFQCSNCRRGFPDKEQCETHESHCNAKQYECYLCEKKKVYYEKKDLNAHMIKHTGEKPCCSICQKRLCSKDALRHHIRTHAESFRYHCSQCRRGFENKKQYKLHENNCKIKRYECYVCKKNCLERKFLLMNHMRCMHVGEETFKCTKWCCQESFNTNLKLKKHLQNCQKKDE